ncbi:unnamed protein product, partial [Nesidiocoris tenuis]
MIVKSCCNHDGNEYFRDRTSIERLRSIRVCTPTSASGLRLGIMDPCIGAAKYLLQSFGHTYSPERNLFRICRIGVVGLLHLRWDQEPGAFQYRPSGFWVASMLCALSSRTGAPRACSRRR